MQFTRLEQEAIVLGAVSGMIDEMVNHSVFCPLGEKRHHTNLMPRTSDTLRQFGILLRDFLSPVTVKGSGPLPFGLDKPADGNRASDFTTLFYLRSVCAAPSIGTEVVRLIQVVDSFAAWLDGVAVVPRVWLSNIDVEVDLRIKRLDFIRISGHIGKHNFLRLGGQARRLRTILAQNGVNIDESDAYLALPDCWDWFHTHLLAFHASSLAEFLNEIRYEIRAYVAPVARARLEPIKDLPGCHSFHRPEEIRNNFAWAQYHGLLHRCLASPLFPRFSVSPNFKTQF